MSFISNIYDHFDRICTATFSTRKELTNPYSLADNEDQRLRSGYAFILESSSNSKQLAYLPVAYQRTISVIVTQRVFGTEKAINPRQEAEKLLLEAAYLITKALKNDRQLKGDIDRIDVESDGGIESVLNEKNQYLFVKIDFTVNYSENFN